MPLTNILQSLIDQALRSQVAKMTFASGLTVAVHPETNYNSERILILSISRHEQDPALKEWYVMLKFWPYPVAPFKPEKFGRHTFTGEIPLPPKEK